MSFKISDLPKEREGENVLGIEELKEVIEFAAAFGNAYGEAIEDGLDLGDILDFIFPLTKLPAAVSGLDKVKEEILNLTQEEAIELADFVVSEFDIPQDGAEEYIEDAVSMALTIWQFILKHHIRDEEE